MWARGRRRSVAGMLNHPYMTKALVDARQSELRADAATTRKVTERPARKRFVLLVAVPRPREECC
jgi:hypothetical protein